MAKFAKDGSWVLQTYPWWLDLPCPIKTTKTCRPDTGRLTRLTMFIKVQLELHKVVEITQLADPSSSHPLF